MNLSNHLLICASLALMILSSLVGSATPMVATTDNMARLRFALVLKSLAVILAIVAAASENHLLVWPIR
ncbi:hypothetical protein BAJUN_01300 [Bajunvirus bajun]|uniref:Uncharacterized protein n=1 Tax=Brevundimonas phage vB_BgoS-Bajun TaxID=2948594 RepID=A0A9E7N638_9CAUD|nr:hypothetical protein BAJUN_01300 [Brevundimonas phage vB_BgoS-Bajun]